MSQSCGRLGAREDNIKDRRFFIWKISHAIHKGISMNFGELLVGAYIKMITLPLVLLPARKRNIFLAHISERTVVVNNIDTAFGPIHFYCPAVLPEYRARTLLSKEPETIAWIDNFVPGETLWDIGANIGCYSLYAAKKGLNVVAFEPNPYNFSILSKNLELNNLTNSLSAFCLALSTKTRISFLNMSTTAMGGALAMFGEKQMSIVADGVSAEVVHAQAMIGFSVDEFIESFSPAFPNHIKLDVDGLEGKILEGASVTLEDRRIKSILVEIDEGDVPAQKFVRRFLADKGFSLSHRDHSKELDNSQFYNVYNNIFVR